MPLQTFDLGEASSVVTSPANSETIQFNNLEFPIILGLLELAPANVDFEEFRLTSSDFGNYRGQFRTSGSARSLNDDWETYLEAIVLSRDTPAATLTLPGPNHSTNQSRDTEADYDWFVPSARNQDVEDFITGHEGGARYTLTLFDGVVSPPGEPQDFTAERVGNQTDLSWSAPDSNGGATITSYRLERSADGGSTWETLQDTLDTSYSDTTAALQQDVLYRVFAVNSEGDSDPSETLRVRTGPYTTTAPSELSGTVAGLEGVDTAIIRNARLVALGSLPLVEGLEIDYGLNAASLVSCRIPRDSPGASVATVGRWVDVYRGGTFAIRSRVIDRRVGDTEIELSCLGEEVVLEDVILPPAYGDSLGPLDLADLARLLCQGTYYPIRLGWLDDWDRETKIARDSAVGNTVGTFYDTTTGQAQIRNSSNTNVLTTEDVFLRLSVESREVPDFRHWERIRWEQSVLDGGNPADDYTTVSYREFTDDDYYHSVAAGRGLDDDDLGDYEPTDGHAWTEPFGNLDFEESLLERMHVRIDWVRSATGIRISVGLFEILARQNIATVGTTQLPEATGLLLTDLQTEGQTALGLLKSVCDSVGYAFRVRLGELYLVNTLESAERPIVLD